MSLLKQAVREMEYIICTIIASTISYNWQGLPSISTCTHQTQKLRCTVQGKQFASRSTLRNVNQSDSRLSFNMIEHKRKNINFFIIQKSV